MLGLLTTLAYSGIDSMGYWMLAFIYGMPEALLISSVLGIAAMLVLAKIIRNQTNNTSTE